MWCHGVLWQVGSDRPVSLLPKPGAWLHRHQKAFKSPTALTEQQYSAQVQKILIWLFSVQSLLWAFLVVHDFPWLDFAKLIITHWSNTILTVVISWLDFIHTVRKYWKPRVLIIGQWTDISSKQRGTERRRWWTKKANFQVLPQQVDEASA